MASRILAATVKSFSLSLRVSGEVRNEALKLLEKTVHLVIGADGDPQALIESFLGKVADVDAPFRELIKDP